MASEPVAPIVLHRYDLSSVREHFMYPDDQYRHWVVLAPVSGRMTFALTPDDGEPTEGSCSSDGVVMCPPGVRLHRRLTEPSRFWFAEFELADPNLTPWWPSGHVRIADRTRLRTDYDLLDQSVRLREPRRTVQRTHALLDVLLLIGRENEPATRPADAAAVRGATLLEQHLADPELSIEAVAAAVHLSRTQFTRRFSDAYGIPPIRHLTELRIARACRLLLDTDKSVTEISQECGYSSPFYFTRVFRGFTGDSPTGYRTARRV